jgi:hypothetical protein
LFDAIEAVIEGRALDHGLTGSEVKALLTLRGCMSPTRRNGEVLTGASLEEFKSKCRAIALAL